MLVRFKFECLKHGEFDHYFNSAQYPDRNFPLLTVICPEENCNRLADYIPGSNMEPDSYWSGKSIDALNLPNVTSKSYLRRYLKTNNITQLAEDEIGHHTKFVSKEDRIKAAINKKDKERREFISNELDKYGVIDGVT